MLYRAFSILLTGTESYSNGMMPSMNARKASWKRTTSSFTPQSSIVVELPGVELEHDSPQPSIETDLIPHGQAEDAAARNANQEPFDVVGVEPVAVIHAEDGEIDSDSDKEDDNGIIAINDAPLPVAQDPLVLSDSSNDEPNDDEHDSVDDSDDDDDDDPSFADAVAEQDDSGDDEDKEQEIKECTDQNARTRGLIVNTTTTL